jgi:hypothetical protein
MDFELCEGTSGVYSGLRALGLPVGILLRQLCRNGLFLSAGRCGLREI